MRDRCKFQFHLNLQTDGLRGSLESLRNKVNAIDKMCAKMRPEKGQTEVNGRITLQTLVLSFCKIPLFGLITLKFPVNALVLLHILM